MTRRTLFFLVCTLSLLAPLHSTFAATVTLTFDEMFNVPADGLTFKGVTFGFDVNGAPSTDALYGTNGPGGFLSEGAVLGGDGSGILSLSFVQPTPTLEFSVVLYAIGMINPGFLVTLFDESLQPIGVHPVITESAPFFSGAIFTSPGGLISHAVIDFNEDAMQLGPPRFALDNLKYQTPEPGTLVLVAAGLAAMIIPRRLINRR